MVRTIRYNAKKKLALAKKLSGEIDDRLETLGKLIETSKTRKEAEAIHLIIERNSEYMRPQQIADIWDYLVNWKKVPWE